MKKKTTSKTKTKAYQISYGRLLVTDPAEFSLAKLTSIVERLNQPKHRKAYENWVLRSRRMVAQVRANARQSEKEQQRLMAEARKLIKSAPVHRYTLTNPNVANPTRTTLKRTEQGWFWLINRRRGARPLNQRLAIGLIAEAMRCGYLIKSSAR